VAGRWKLEGSSCPRYLDTPFCKERDEHAWSVMPTNCRTARKDHAVGPILHVLALSAAVHSERLVQRSDFANHKQRVQRITLQTKHVGGAAHHVCLSLMLHVRLCNLQKINQ
jgi:hypothetical protein